MLDLKTLLLILIFLFLLNQIKVKNNFGSENFTNDKINPLKIRENNLNIEQNKNKNKLNDVNLIENNVIFGQDQYITNNFVNNKNLKYQNLDVLKSTNDLELTSKLNFNYVEPNLNSNSNSEIKFKYEFDSTNLANKEINFNYNLTNYNLTNLNKPDIINKFNEETATAIVNSPIYDVPWTTELPNDQKMINDYKFNDMNKEKLHQIINSENYDFENKTIKEVYDDLVLDYKKINKEKKIINNDLSTILDTKVTGAFGEKSLAPVYWSYQEDVNNFGFDPAQTLELAL